jgi:LL-diaminopimelate aminotransferase
VQDAGIAALRSPDRVVDDIRKIYQHRIEILYQALRDLGLEL